MFVDSQSRVDREGLRLYVLEQLKQMKLKAEHLSGENNAFWDKTITAAKKNLFAEEQQRVIKVIHELRDLPRFMTMWMETAVDSPERFEFFVLSKAQEMRSGDQAKDYFWALQIRHDQLVALVRVLDLLLSKITLWMKIRPAELFDDPVFSGLSDFGIEDQIYLEAEKVYRERQRILGA